MLQFWSKLLSFFRLCLAIWKVASIFQKINSISVKELCHILICICQPFILAVVILINLLVLKYKACTSISKILYYWFSRSWFCISYKIHNLYFSISSLNFFFLCDKTINNICIVLYIDLEILNLAIRDNIGERFLIIS